MSGSGLYTPSVTVHYLDNTEEVYAVNFVIEETRPTIEFTDVSFTTVDDVQYLNFTFEASDDMDITNLSMRAAGIRASDLRAAAGVVEKALEIAFKGNGLSAA